MTVAPFYLVADVCRRPGRTTLVAWAVVFGCVAAAVEGLIDYAGGGASRLSLGSIENAVPAAEYLGAGLALSLGLLIGSSRSRWAAACAAGACLLTVVALLFTGSRGPTAGAAAGAVLVTAVGLRRRVYSVLVLVGILAAAFWFAAANPGSRMSGGAFAGSHGASFRRHTWEETSALIAQRPLLGHGLGTFAELGVFYEDRVWGGRVQNAHNVWLHTASETGLLGAGALAFFLVLGPGAIARNIRRGSGFPRAVSVGSLGAVAALLVAGIFSVTTDAEPGALLFALMAMGQEPPAH
jgi:O-antigen ligase